MKNFEEKAHLDSNSQYDDHNPLNVSNIFEENGVEEYSNFKYTNNQKRILDTMEKKIQSG